MCVQSMQGKITAIKAVFIVLQQVTHSKVAESLDSSTDQMLRILLL